MKPQELSIGNIVEVNHYEYGDMFAMVWDMTKLFQ